MVLVLGNRGFAGKLRLRVAPESVQVLSTNPVVGLIQTVSGKINGAG